MEIVNLDVKDYPRFLALYNETFPADQRRLYRDEKHLDTFITERNGKFHGFAVKDGDLFLGFLTYWVFKGYVYIEHLAVDPAHRSKNIGRKLLSHLFNTVSPNVLVEVELPESEDDRRRIRFYEQNGFRQREEFKYIQPPYSSDQHPLELLLMTHGDVKLSERRDIAEMLKEVYNVND